MTKILPFRSKEAKNKAQMREFLDKVLADGAFVLIIANGANDPAVDIRIASNNVIAEEPALSTMQVLLLRSLGYSLIAEYGGCG